MPPRSRRTEAAEPTDGRDPIEQLLRANQAYAASFAESGAPGAPAKRLAVVTCMDARLLPSRMLGLAPGEAHVIRNAGGSAREALRSLVISQRLLGTKAIAVIKHTDCGMLTFTNRELHERVERDLGSDASAIDFMPFGSLEQAIRDDVTFLEGSPLIDSRTVVRGFIYDVESGLLSEMATP